MKRWLAYLLLLVAPCVALAQSYPAPLYTYTQPGGLITKPMFSELAEEMEDLQAAIGVNFTGIDNHAFAAPTATGLVSAGTGITAGSPASAAFQSPVLSANPPTVNGQFWPHSDGSWRYYAGGTLRTITPTSAGITAMEDEGVAVSPFQSTLNCTGTGVTCSSSGGKLVLNVPGGGVTAFTSLTDVPSSYTGHGTKLVSVNSGATGLEFRVLLDADIPSLPTSKITSGTFDDARLAAAITRDTEWDTLAELEAVLGVTFLTTASTVDGDQVSFDDQNADFVATNVDEAIEELVSVNGSGPNAADGKVEWSQLVGVPAGFSDGTDDGAGGSGDSVSVGGAAAADANFIDSDSLDFTLDTGTTPDDITATLKSAVAGNGLVLTSQVIDVVPASGSNLVANANDLDWTGLTARKNSGANVGTRPRYNFIEGANVTLTVADDGTDDEIDVTVASTGGSGSPGGSTTQFQYNNAGAFGGTTGFTWDETNKRISFTSGTVDAGGTDSAFDLAVTMPTSPTATVEGVAFDITGAGSASQVADAFVVDYIAGYTGSSITRAVAAVNRNAGTGANLQLGTLGVPSANIGQQSTVLKTAGVGAGYSIALAGEARDSSGVNVGMYGKSVDSEAGSNIGILGSAANSTEATDLKNIAVLGTLASSLPTENKSAAGYFDGGTLADANSHILRLLGTLPSSPSGAAPAILVDVTSAGSAAQEQRGLLLNLLAGYTGSAHTAGAVLVNAAASTGTSINLNSATVPSGSVGFRAVGNASGAGWRYGGLGEALNSTGGNIGFYGRSVAAVAGSNIGILGNGANSTEATTLKNIGVLGTLQSALTSHNKSAAGYFDGGALSDINTYAIYALATLTASPSATTVGALFDIASAGSASQAQVGMRSSLGAGYTGSSSTIGMQGTNVALGTGTGIGSGNFGVSGNVGGVGAGWNTGIAGAANGSTGANIGTLGNVTIAAAGSAIGILGYGAASTEATDLKNIGVLGTLASSLPTENKSAAGYFDGGTLADINTHIIRARGTLPSSPSSTATAYLFEATGAGSTAQVNTAATINQLAGYTGSSRTSALNVNQVSAGTGADLALDFGPNPAGNVGVYTLTNKASVGAGYSIGHFAEVRDSSGVNVAMYGKARASEAGTNIGLLGSAANSTEATDFKDIAVVATRHTSLPTGSNVSMAMLVDGAGADMARFYNAGTLKSSIDSEGSYISPNYTVAGLPTCNAGKKYARAAVSDGTACTFAATLTGGGSTACPVFCDGTNWIAG